MVSYQNLSSFEWESKLQRLKSFLQEGCFLCPRDCGIKRSEKTPGWCGGIEAEKVLLYSWNLHLGEEPPLSGERGSGTIFFTGCNLGCKFCQNFPISHLKNGTVNSITQLADKMLELQRKGAHNINFVTPTPWTYQIVEAIYLASRRGLNIPIVWNSSGWEKAEVIKLLEGIVDIYLPDLKCIKEENSLYFSGRKDYFKWAASAIREMYRQVGKLKIGENGIAQQGVLIRHLVLPQNLSDSYQVLKYLREKFGADVFVSVMSQYFPAYKAIEDPILKNRISPEEYDKLIEYVESLGMENVFIQEI
jgi:putative pyruvate formate lyase activating enzyme